MPLTTRTRAALFLFLWIVVIAVFSTSLAAHGTVTQLLLRVSRAAGAGYSPPQIESAAWLLRKAAHPVAYGVLAFLLLNYLSVRFAPERPVPPVRLYAIAFALAVLVGVIDELHQSIVPQRGGSAVDVLLDAGGAALALLAHYLLAARRGRAPTPRPRTR